MSKFQDRIDELRRDPDFQELVRLMRALPDDRLDAWYDEYEAYGRPEGEEYADETEEDTDEG